MNEEIRKMIEEEIKFQLKTLEDRQLTPSDPEYSDIMDAIDKLADILLCYDENANNREGIEADVQMNKNELLKEVLAGVLNFCGVGVLAGAALVLAKRVMKIEEDGVFPSKIFELIKLLFRLKH